MVFNIGCGLRWRTYAKGDRTESVFLVQRAGSVIGLMRLQFETVGGEGLGKTDQPCSPTPTPFRRIDIQPVEIGLVHGEVCDNLLIPEADPDGTFGSDDL